MTYFAKAYRWILLAPAVLPLFYVDGLMYPMLAPKTFALRAVGIIAVALFSYLALSGQTFFWARLQRFQTWIPAALLAIAYLASLQGLGFYHSFWSTFERGDGLLTLSVCVGYFYLFLLSADQLFTRKFLHLVAWVGSIAGLYVFIQWVALSAGLDLSFIAKANGRVGGTMGNAAFLAAYLGMTFFITLASAPEYIGWKRTLLYWGAGFQIAGIVLAATRGTLFALVLIGLAVLIHEAVRGSGVRRMWALRSVVAVVCCGALFFMFRAEIARIPFEPIDRIATVSFTDGTVSSRLFLWGHLLPVAFERPLLGVGAEHIEALFDRVYDPTKILEEWFDRSHNAYLDYLLQYGVLGLLLYLALILFGALASWRSRTPYLFLVFAIYALQNIFVFDTGVTLWLFLALLALVFVKENEGVATNPVPRNTYVGGAVGLLILLLLVPVVVNPLRANRLAFIAYLYNVVDVARTHAATTEGLALHTYADLEFGYNAYFMYTDEQLSYLKGEALTQAYDNALGTLTQNLERYPYDARTAVYLAHVLDSAPPGVAVDRVFERKVLTQAIALSPKRAQPWYILANLAIAEAKDLPAGAAKNAQYKTALDTLRAYVILVPTLSEPHFVLAELYTALGDTITAATEAELGRTLYTPDLLTARRAARYYEKMLDLPNAAFFLEEILKFEPSNEAARSDLDLIHTHEQSN